jgi:hypothetical protein
MPTTRWSHSTLDIIVWMFVFAGNGNTDIMDTDPIGGRRSAVGGRRSAVGGLIVPEFQLPSSFQLPPKKNPLHLRRHLLPHLLTTEGRTSVSHQQQMHLHVASQVISTWHSYSYSLCPEKNREKRRPDCPLENREFEMY